MPGQASSTSRGRRDFAPVGQPATPLYHEAGLTPGGPLKNPVPDSRSVPDHNAANDQKWSQRAATYDDARHDYFRFMQRELIALTRISAPAAFLDLGCGTGWAVRYVADRLKGNGRFVGVDIASGMIERARRKADGLPNVEFYQASVDHLPLDDNAFDVAICSNSFHHYLRPAEALQEIMRVLRPGGRLHILDVTADDALIRWIDSRVRAREKEHVRFYGTAEFVRLFEQAGLKHVRSSRIRLLYPLKVHIAKKGS